MPPPPSAPQTPRYITQANAFATQQMMRPTNLQPQQMQQQQVQQIVYTQNHPQAQQMLQQQMHNPYAMTASGPMHMNRPMVPAQMGTPTTPGGHPMQVMGPPPAQVMQHMQVQAMGGPMDPRLQQASNESPPPKAKRKRPTKKQKEQMEQQKQMQQNLMVAPGHQQMTAQEFYLMQQQQQRVPPVNMHLPQNMQPQQRMAYPPQYPPGYPQQASTSIMPQGQFPGQQHGYPPGRMQQAQQLWHHTPNVS